jgi:hypothetical protein
MTSFERWIVRGSRIRCGGAHHRSMRHSRWRRTLQLHRRFKPQHLRNIAGQESRRPCLETAVQWLRPLAPDRARGPPGSSSFAYRRRCLPPPLRPAQFGAVARLVVALERGRLVITSAAVQECRLGECVRGRKDFRHERAKISLGKLIPKQGDKITGLGRGRVVMEHAIRRTTQSPGGWMRTLEHARTSLPCRLERETIMLLGLRLQ